MVEMCLFCKGVSFKFSQRTSLTPHPSPWEGLSSLIPLLLYEMASAVGITGAWMLQTVVSPGVFCNGPAVLAAQGNGLMLVVMSLGSGLSSSCMPQPSFKVFCLLPIFPSRLPGLWNLLCGRAGYLLLFWKETPGILICPFEIPLRSPTTGGRSSTKFQYPAPAHGTTVLAAPRWWWRHHPWENQVRK